MAELETETTAPVGRRREARRVLLVSSARYALPLDAPTRRKFDALEEAGLELRVLACSRAGRCRDDRFELAATSRLGAAGRLAFFAGLPRRVARELAGFRPDAVFVQGTLEATCVFLARRLTGSRPRVVLDVEGDWRATTRLYGSRLRSLVSPFADRLSRHVLTRADGVRAIGPYTSGLVSAAGVEPAASFPTYIEAESFVARPVAPPPDRPCVLFVGVLERTKNVDLLAAAWRLVAPRCPGALLRVVGDGSRAAVVRDLVRDRPGQTEWIRATLSSSDVAAAMDDSTVLAIPSRSEGMGRVAIEALARGRPVVASAVGGLPDIVQDGVNGYLVDADDAQGLADALLRLLDDRELAARLGEAASRSASTWLLDADEYADRFRRMIDDVLATPR